MIKEWATVVSWQRGVAQVRCEAREGCGSCHARQSCGTRLLEKMAPDTQHYLAVASALPLVPGQRVEVGINEGSLLRSAFLVYMLPLLGLIGGAAMLQGTLGTDPAAACGGVAGGVAGFLCARYLASHTSETRDNQPVILQVALPPSSLHVQD
ncbi:SoxR-reducing system protein RseC [Candidatus Sodalis endolongispinus]|uniref:SoxR-reducing system protein RseC n=1 Tax=Candidatus Sodalis endolongispinus TaxID=2812662 RepID=A0ABS5YB72_9GAMM|nr:SoxR-reducing system protein RseC [Candidatus Sodalis endolongispinus]MBT9432214.1 SoxR-reducing system protein RseC [Candidatus Sodalis endolongispinus]